jgi:hypothetical protein
MLVRFVSVYSSNYQGFSASIHAVTPPSSPLYMTAACPGPLYLSARVASVVESAATSPYPANMDCTIVVVAQNQSQALRLTLVDFSTRINYDTLTLRSSGPSGMNLAFLSGDLADLSATTYVVRRWSSLT